MPISILSICTDMEHFLITFFFKEYFIFSYVTYSYRNIYFINSLYVSTVFLSHIDCISFTNAKLSGPLELYAADMIQKTIDRGYRK